MCPDPKTALVQEVAFGGARRPIPSQPLRKCDLPAAEVIDWCSAMLENDRVGFIASELLQSLRKHFQTTAAQ